MGLKADLALKSGFQKAFSKKGITLMLGFFLINIPNFLITNAGLNKVIDVSYLESTGVIGFLSGFNSVILASMLIATYLIYTVFYAVALRALKKDGGFIRFEYLKRNIVSTTMNLFLGGLVFFIIATSGLWLIALAGYLIGGPMVLAMAIGLGLILFLTLGLSFMAIFIYFVFFVAIEDEGFYEALKSSWELTEGDRANCLGLFIIIAVSIMVIQMIFSVGAGTLAFLATGKGYIASSMYISSETWVQVILQSLQNGVIGIIVLGIYADAYNQMK